MTTKTAQTQSTSAHVRDHVRRGALPRKPRLQQSGGHGFPDTQGQDVVAARADPRTGSGADSRSRLERIDLDRQSKGARPNAIVGLKGTDGVPGHDAMTTRAQAVPITDTARGNEGRVSAARVKTQGAAVQPLAPPEILAFSIAEFCRRHGISRAHFYNLWTTGEAPTVMRVGRRTLISAEAAAQWRRRMEEAGPGDPTEN